MFKPASIFLMGPILLCVSFGSLAKAEILIIANKASKISQLNNTQAQKLWLGEIHKLPGVGRIKVLDQLSKSEIKEEFYEKVIEKSLSELKVHWAKIIFTGKAVPPKTLSSDKKVIELVSKNKNMLGYIDSKDVTDDVKVLMTIK